MTAVPPGVPGVPPRPLAPRRRSRQLEVGPVAVGGGAPASAQSVTTTRTRLLSRDPARGVVGQPVVMIEAYRQLAAQGDYPLHLGVTEAGPAFQGTITSAVALRVAVTGCGVNGPGEAREADLGVASGNGKGQIFVRGEAIKTVPESKIVETVIEEAQKLAEQKS
ncbi:flavodoxin-dependent (E)-4-hydroxy-3-methylbut-2-enyl-diphosphate synthase [Streptomyces sp. NPDC001606]